MKILISFAIASAFMNSPNRGCNQLGFCIAKTLE
jgi:hypothetical protein